MLGIRKLTHITQAVRDRDLSHSLYRDVFDARTFHSGPIDDDGDDDATLVAFHNLCLKLVSLSDLERQVGRHLATGEGFHAVGFQVEDLKAAEAVLHQEGIRIILRGPSRLLTDPEDTYGTMFELRESALPSDPRDTPDWHVEKWGHEHPLGIQDLWGISVLVNDPSSAEAFCRRVLGAHHLQTKITTEIARSLTFFTVAGAPMALVESAGEASELAKVTGRLKGGQGVHAICLISGKLQDVPGHFRSRGIGLLQSPNTRHIPHPRAMMGARYIFMERPHEDDPRYQRAPTGAG